MRIIIRYTKILIVFIKFSLMNLANYRMDFFLGFIGSLLYNLGAILFLEFILAKIDTIAGWDVYDMILLYGVGQFWAYLYFFATYGNMRHFNEMIESGEMDMVLLKPLDSMFLATLKNFDFLNLIALIQPIGIVFYAVSNKEYEITILSIVSAAILLIFSTILTHLIEVILSSIAFWTIHSELGNMFIMTSQIATYPYEIFRSRVFRLLFLTLVPYGILLNVPFRTLINRIDYRLIFILLCVTVFFFFLSRFIWKQGLKKYQSASS